MQENYFKDRGIKDAYGPYNGPDLSGTQSAKVVQTETDPQTDGFGQFNPNLEPADTHVPTKGPVDLDGNDLFQ